MRILVVGAGAIGGYFGGRLIEAGRDVTFLVRPQRARELAASGLVIKSPLGDALLRGVKTVLAEDLNERFDLVLLSCKAYDLDSAIASFAPAVGPATLILPMLNGMLHLDALDSRFSHSQVLGGQCAISVTLNKERTIVELQEKPSLSFGGREGADPERIKAVAALMQGVKFAATMSTDIVADMWRKWFFLATLAGGTCLFRAPVGDIVAAPQGGETLLALLAECASVAQANGYTQSADTMAVAHKRLTTVGAPSTASMLRDIENGARTEADHIVGDLIARASSTSGKAVAVPLLRIVYTHLKAYESRRARMAASTA